MYVHVYDVNPRRFSFRPGGPPNPSARFVEAGAEVHPDELERAWAAVIQGETPEKIAPLQ